jgi:hypothetical protein
MTAVLGWRCPWSGDGSDPVPRRYWAWYRLYNWTRRAKHLVGWHDWRQVGFPNLPPDSMYVRLHEHCDWCGANRDPLTWEDGP